MAVLALAGQRALAPTVLGHQMTDDVLRAAPMQEDKPPEAKPAVAKASERKAADAAAEQKPKKTRRPSAKALVREIEERIGHTFKNPALLKTALTHVSALKSSQNRTDSYQRLEFLGDHVLGLIVSDMLYGAFPKADEGEMSKRLADLVRKEACVDVAKSLGLHETIKLGTVGAGVGAIIHNGGYDAAEQFVLRNWTERMRRPVRPLRDPKTVLQEWAQGKGLPTPSYREVERTGPHHAPRFRVAVALPGLASAEGIGSSKRAAETAAASALLRREGVSGGKDA